jgi:DNA-binding CsgD family transcriptional regulator
MSHPSGNHYDEATRTPICDPPVDRTESKVARGEARRLVGLPERAEVEPAGSLVRIEIDDDDEAARVSVVLEALGFRVYRVGMADDLSRRGYATLRLIALYRLRPTEARALRLLASGETDAEIMRVMELSSPSLSWLVENLALKLGADGLHRDFEALRGAINAMIDATAEPVGVER